MRDIEAELEQAEEKVYGNICRDCNRPITSGLTVDDKNARWPKCNECATRRYVYLLDSTLY